MTKYSETQKKNHAHKRSKNERMGAIPFGQRLAADGIHLEPHPAEQAALARIAELRAQGVSFAQIARRLGEEGHPPRGKSWHKTTVARLVKTLELHDAPP